MAMNLHLSKKLSGHIKDIIATIPASFLCLIVGDCIALFETFYPHSIYNEPSHFSKNLTIITISKISPVVFIPLFMSKRFNKSFHNPCKVEHCLPLHLILA